MDLSATIHLLGDLLGQVISELESPALFATEEHLRGLAKARRSGDQQADSSLRAAVAALDAPTARVAAAAFTLYFDLVNLAEEEYRVSVLRQREAERYPEPIDDSIAEAAHIMSSGGMTAASMRQLLESLQIELVLTAHPTEARRRSIMSKLLRITYLVRAWAQSELSERERHDVRTGIYREITALWLTDRARTTRPAVTDEVRTGLYYVDEVFWEALPRIYSDLDAALARYYPQLKISRPWFTLGSWIGGDRDGNPNVTVEVTAETLRLHRGLAIERPRRALQELSRCLSVSGERVPPPAALREWLQAHEPLPAHAAYLAGRYPTEPYRLALSLLAADLGEASQDDMTARLLSGTPHVARVTAGEITAPLGLIADALPPPLAQGPLELLRRQFEIFGLHGARLDIREDSARLTEALAEITRALGEHPELGSAAGPQRRQSLVRLLSQPPPALARQVGVTERTAQTWALFRLIARARALYGQELLGPFVISMAHDAADVLAVLLLATWTGCAEGLQIVPLFETVADLKGAPAVLADLFSIEAYRRHLEASGGEQMVMVGYSDSNKDGGYLAANWAIYQAQEEIAAACRRHGVRLTFFHGRGGTVARGGGPANRAIRAQPPGTVEGRFRVTEQGEVLAARYANPELAHRHLEQIVSAVLLASAPDAAPGASRSTPLPASWRRAMRALSRAALAAYRELVFETPGFMDFWQAATPIDEISRLQIGSRPAARRSGSLDVRRVRAIPWVFSWMQSRFNLPAWYGLGSALAGRPSTELGLLREMYTGWPFLQAMLDNAEMAMMKADMEIAHVYGELVRDRELASSILQRIDGEFERTREAVLGVTGHSQLLDGDPIIQRSVHLRNPYVDPLNYIQVEVLRRLRTLQDDEGSEARELHEVMVLTINGIAAGLRNTG